LRCAVIDTNALIYSFLQKVDLFNELRSQGIKLIIVPRTVVRELEELKKQGGKLKIASNIALEFVKEKCKFLNSEKKKTDLDLIDVAKKYGCIIITNDKKLKRLARDNGITVGYISHSRVKLELG